MAVDRNCSARRSSGSRRSINTKPSSVMYGNSLCVAARRSSNPRSIVRRLAWLFRVIGFPPLFLQGPPVESCQPGKAESIPRVGGAELRMALSRQGRRPPGAQRVIGGGANATTQSANSRFAAVEHMRYSHASRTRHAQSVADIFLSQIECLRQFPRNTENVGSRLPEARGAFKTNATSLQEIRYDYHGT